MAWIRMGNANVWTGEQGTPEWLALRFQKIRPGQIEPYRRLGSSTIGTAIGRSKFETPEQLAANLLRLAPDKQVNDAMRAGTLHEDRARKMYEEQSGNSVTQIGIAYPDFAPDTIAVSPDGLVGDDGMIEIKCPARMYGPIHSGHHYGNLVSAGVRGDMASLHNAVWPTHMDQMQLIMKSLGRAWCDYVVLSLDTDELLITRIPFDPEHWEKIMSPGITRFFEVVVPKVLRELFDQSAQ